jgi:hypothetical protein
MAIRPCSPMRDPFLRTRLRANQRSPRCVLFRRLVWSLDQLSLSGSTLGSLSRSPAHFSAWQDNSICAVEQQLATAHNFGSDFFVFDWYFNVAVNDSGAPGNNWTTGVS